MTETKKANERQVGGSHYCTPSGVQHWDLFGPDYLIGYATKYMRWRKKGGVEDLEKAIHVVEKLREQLSETSLPMYDRDKTLRWCAEVGLDWTETHVVLLIMFPQGRSSLDDAIEGIRHLIAQYGRMPSAEEQLKSIAKPGKRPPGFDAGSGKMIYAGDEAWFVNPDNSLSNRQRVKVTDVLQDGDAEIEFGNGEHRMVKWRTLSPITKTYADMTLDELREERARLIAANESATHWGAAVGQRSEWIREIDMCIAMKERRVPRFPAQGGVINCPPGSENKTVAEMLTPDAGHPPYDPFAHTDVDDNVPAKLSSGEYSFDKGRTWHKGGDAEAMAAMVQRTPADGAQHASLFPWRITNDQYYVRFAGRTPHAHAFYSMMGTEARVLEVMVEQHELPRELAPCYNLWRPESGGPPYWLISIERVPADLRDQYPRLLGELNAKEWGDLPKWQQPLYKWYAGEQKWRLLDSQAAWGPEL